MQVSVDGETSQTIISGMGELHLEVYVERMRREYDVSFFFIFADALQMLAGLHGGVELASVAIPGHVPSSFFLREHEACPVTQAPLFGHRLGR